MNHLDPDCPDCPDFNRGRFCDWHASTWLTTEAVAFQIEAYTRQVAWEQSRLPALDDHTGPFYGPDRDPIGNACRMLASRQRSLDFYRTVFAVRGL